MKPLCPKCNQVELNTTIRKEIEVDYCPKCNGIWLDNGELNKLISQYTKKAKDDEQALSEMKERANTRTSVTYHQTNNSKGKSLVGTFLDLIDL